MSLMSPETRNTPSSIAARFSENKLAWWPVLLFLPARLVFAFVAHGIAAALLAMSGSSNGWADATAWWPVYSTITDVLCLAALVWLTRREGLNLLDLFGVRSLRAAVRQLAWVPPYFLAVLPAVAVAAVITQLFYASPITPMMTVVDLPAAGATYARLVWPLVWVVTEELVYIGYLLPRMEVRVGRSWVAILVVLFFWGLQHIAIPWIPDPTYLTWRLLSATVAVAGFPIVFVLWGRRLIPLIVIHYFADITTALMATGVIQIP